MIMCSDLVEHVGTKHAGDEGVFNNQHQNPQSHAVCVANMMIGPPRSHTKYIEHSAHGASASRRQLAQTSLVTLPSFCFRRVPLLCSQTIVLYSVVTAKGVPDRDSGIGG